MNLKTLETPIRILGSTTETKHDIESNPANSRIAPLWGEFLQKGGTESIPEAKSPAIYAVYNQYESDVTGMYTLTLGAETISQDDTLNSALIPAGEYLVFEGKGPAPQCTIEAWQTIWAYFANENSDYKRAYTTDFEAYTGPENVSIYINIS